MKLRPLLTFALSLNIPLLAQTPTTPAPSPAATENKNETVRERERTIYVPYEELEKAFKDGGKGVFLPYKEFLELWNELTMKRQADEVKPPQEGVVSKAEYTGRVEGETMIIDAKVTVESFKKGWLKMPLAPSGQVPGITEADTGKAVLQAHPEGYNVILPDKGVYELKLKIYAPIKKAAGRQTVSLVLPQAAMSRFTATVPENGWEFKVEPAAAFTSRAAGADTELSFFFGSGTKFDVTWSKPEGATALAPLVLASNSVSAEVHAGSLATTASLNLRILRAPVKSFSLLLPADQTVQAVTGNDVKDWKIEAAGDRQKLTINPNAPVKDEWIVKLTLESPLPKLPAEVTVPEIIVEGATQDRGDISVAAEPQLDVTLKPDTALVQQSQGVSSVQGLSAVGGYRFLKHPAKLALGIAEAKAQVDVDSLTVLTVKRDSSRMEATFNYNVRRVGIFEARVGLPSGWSGWEVVGLPPDSWSVEKVANGEALLVKFGKQVIGPAAFSIMGHQQRANPTEDAVVPVFSPQGVVRYDAKIGVGVPFGLEVNTKSNGDLRIDDVNVIGSVLQLSGGNTYTGATLINAGKLGVQQQAGNVVPPSARADTELTLAFRHRGDVKSPATLSFKARDPQVNVEVLTLMEAKEQSLRHTWTLAFDVAYAGTDKVVIAVPKSVANDIRFADPSVKEFHKNFAADDRLKKALPNADAFEFWEVVLRNERLGPFSLSLSVEKPVAAGAKDAKLELLSVHVPGAFQETGQVAVVKDDSLEVRDAKDTKAENLEDIDPKELRDPLKRGGVFLAYKYKALPLKLALGVTKNSYIEVPQAIVTQSLLTSAVSTDRAQTTEVIYWVKNNAQQFLTVRLPKGASLVSDIFVNGATQQPMKREGLNDVLVRLPSGASVQQRPFPVRFVFEIPSPKPGEKLPWRGAIDVESPTIDPVGVLESHHQLYLPEGQQYTKFEGPMTQSVDDRGWRRIRGLTRLANIADVFIPAFGPRTDSPVEAWHPIAGLPSQNRASLDFQVPHQGQSVKLHRLGPPAAVHAEFRRSKLGYIFESVAFLLIALWGFGKSRQPLARRVIWLSAVGLLAVISTGVLNAADARIAQAVVLALVCVTGVWALLAALGFCRWIFSRRPLAASPAPSPLQSLTKPRHAPEKPKAEDAKPTPAPEPAPPPSAAFSVWTEEPPGASSSSKPDLEFPRIETDDKSSK